MGNGFVRCHEQLHGIQSYGIHFAQCLVNQKEIILLFEIKKGSCFGAHMVLGGMKQIFCMTGKIDT